MSGMHLAQLRVRLALPRAENMEKSSGMVENCGRIEHAVIRGIRDREDPHETSTSSLRRPVHALEDTRPDVLEGSLSVSGSASRKDSMNLGRPEERRGRPADMMAR